MIKVSFDKEGRILQNFMSVAKNKTLLAADSSAYWTEIKILYYWMDSFMNYEVLMLFLNSLLHTHALANNIGQATKKLAND